MDLNYKISEGDNLNIKNILSLNKDGRFVLNQNDNITEIFHNNNRAFIKTTKDLHIHSGNDYTSGVFLKTGNNYWTSTSDVKLKTNINKIRNPLKLLSSIKGVTYNLINDNDKYKDKKCREKVHDEDNYKGKMFGPKKRVGVIAQEVEKVMPELIDVIENENEDYLGVNYLGFIPILIEALKESNKKNKSLEKKVKSLESRMKAVERVMRAMENVINS